MCRGCRGRGILEFKGQLGARGGIGEEALPLASIQLTVFAEGEGFFLTPHFDSTEKLVLKDIFTKNQVCKVGQSCLSQWSVHSLTEFPVREPRPYTLIFFFLHCFSSHV